MEIAILVALEHSEHVFRYAVLIRVYADSSFWRGSVTKEVPAITNCV